MVASIAAALIGAIQPCAFALLLAGCRFARLLVLEGAAAHPVSAALPKFGVIAGVYKLYSNCFQQRALVEGVFLVIRVNAAPNGLDVERIGFHAHEEVFVAAFGWSNSALRTPRLKSADRGQAIRHEPRARSRSGSTASKNTCLRASGSALVSTSKLVSHEPQSPLSTPSERRCESMLVLSLDECNDELHAAA